MNTLKTRLGLLTGWMALLLALVVPEWVHACATCFGNPESPHAKAATLSVLSLLIVTVVVLFGFASFFVTLIVKGRAARRAQQESS